MNTIWTRGTSHLQEQIGRTRNRRGGWWVGVAAILWIGYGNASAQQAETADVSVAIPAVTVHIPAQPLGEALRVFAEQTHLQLVYRAEQINSKISSTAVEGTFPAEEALARLLGGSHLRALRINARTLAVRTGPGIVDGGPARAPSRHCR